MRHSSVATAPGLAICAGESCELKTRLQSTARGAPPLPFAGKTLLSLYGGVGHCCIAVAEGGGDACLVDLAKNSENDLGRPRVAQEIAAVVPNFDCLGIDICCNTWSRARRAPVWSSMPSALRSNLHIMGLPGLNDRDSNTVRLHNYMYRKAMKYAENSLRAGKSGWIENPRTSMLWKSAGVRKLLKLGAVFVDAHFCQYGCPYKKATRFLVWGQHRHRVVLSQCCRRKGICSRTGRKHIELSGLHRGVFRTSAAQVYPLQLCRSLMSQLIGDNAAAPS